MTKHTTIWKSYGMYELKELKEMEQAEKEYLEEYENTEEGEYSDQNITDRIYDSINVWFDDETYNLNKTLNGRILAIADLGLWNGRRTGYKILGNNLKEVLTSTIGCDEKEVYCDGRNVYAHGYHHDGSNSVEYREIREDRNIENLLEKIYNNEPITRKEINYYTKSLRPYIKQIYGI